MKKIYTYIFSLIILSSLAFAQDSLNIPQNSVLKNFRPFTTPRTNYRPGTVFRIDNDGRQYFVEDVKSIKDYTSNEGTIVGRVYFTKDEMLSVLNIEISSEYVELEIEIKEAAREYTEQTNVDKVLWESGKIENIVVDERSKYYLVREAIVTEEVSYRFSEEDFSAFVTGKPDLKKSVPRGDFELDFPYYITKQFEDPRRVFYLKQEVTTEPYKSE